MDDEMNALHNAMGTVWDRIAAVGLDVRVGLVTFVNDVIVHHNAEWLDRPTFFSELESQLRFADGRWYTDQALPRNDVNTDWPENALDAMYRAGNELPWRLGVGRL